MKKGISTLAIIALVAAAHATDLAAQAGGEVQDSTHRVGVIEGLSGPEAVRYDPDQDVWFVSNFNGEGGDRDANGFIARASADGQIDSLHFAQGTPANPLHAPRGMNITGDTLWVVDIDGLHSFDRRSGAQLGFVDMTSFSPGFLNDVSPGNDGAMYVTDTGRSAIYRVRGGETSLLVQSEALGLPNGITLDPSSGHLVIVPWNPDNTVKSVDYDGNVTDTGSRVWPGRLDGVEPWNGGFVIASQSDMSIYMMRGNRARAIISTGGNGADIAVDTRRGRVAVPYIALNRVDIWELPMRGGR